MDSSLKEWSPKDFSEFIKAKTNGLVLFSAPWCSACNTVTPYIAALQNQFQNLAFAKIDVSKNPGLASRYSIMSLPNILFFKTGRVTEQIIGTTSKKTIEEKLKILK